MDNDDEDFSDMLDKLKDLLNKKVDFTDIDLFVFPESRKNSKKTEEKSKRDKFPKGFKISYHFDKGMNKPRIKIDGNYDEKKIRNYLNRSDSSK
ncbi:MAG: hypothetical protein EU547_05625 [Promethearchaeota archaeon]|nr:MAG: hypothetical protein EU547_05625 [Candidatus Lokiarchaeota archaeon]